MLLCEFIWPVQWIFVFLSFFRSLVRRKLFNSLALRGIANILIEKRTQQFFYSFFQFFFLFCSLCKNLFHNGSFSIIHSPQRMYFKLLTSSFEVTFICDANATLKICFIMFQLSTLNYVISWGISLFSQADNVAQQISLKTNYPELFVFSKYRR